MLYVKKQIEISLNPEWHKNVCLLKSTLNDVSWRYRDSIAKLNYVSNWRIRNYLFFISKISNKLHSQQKECCHSF